MTARPIQLAFDLPHEVSHARSDFLVAPGNAEAVAMIEAWPNWPSPTVMLVGPVGSGKSHLGAIWAGASGARVVKGSDLVDIAPPDIAVGEALLIEDADDLGSGETPLFHLLNLIRERGMSALITAKRAPNLWGLRTQDLLSRLRLAPIVELGEPDLELTQAVLLKLFSDRQLLVEPTVVNYIAPRIERSLDAARGIVAALDREALARGKPVTRAMAAQILRDGEET